MKKKNVFNTISAFSVLNIAFICLFVIYLSIYKTNTSYKTEADAILRHIKTHLLHSQKNMGKHQKEENKPVGSICLRVQIND